MKRTTRQSSLLFVFFTFIALGTAQFFVSPIFFKIPPPPPGGDPYKKYWSEVDSLEKLGLTESANKVVKKIYGPGRKGQKFDSTY